MARTSPGLYPSPVEFPSHRAEPGQNPEVTPRRQSMANGCDPAMQWWLAARVRWRPTRMCLTAQGL